MQEMALLNVINIICTFSVSDIPKIFPIHRVKRQNHVNKILLGYKPKCSLSHPLDSPFSKRTLAPFSITATSHPVLKKIFQNRKI